MPLTQAQQAALDELFPESETLTREGPGGRPLTYAPAEYLIGRMNAIFGSGGWRYRSTVEMIPGTEQAMEKPARRRGEPSRQVWVVSYRATCALWLADPVVALDGSALPIAQDVGAGHGEDPKLGIAHESALKEAATDALKRAIRSLGWSVGLALYEKRQSHVLKRSKAPREGAGPDASRAPAKASAPVQLDALLQQLAAEGRVPALTPAELDRYFAALGKPLWGERSEQNRRQVAAWLAGAGPALSAWLAEGGAGAQS